MISGVAAAEVAVRRANAQEDANGPKHAAIVRSLQDSASSIGLADVIDIWEFNDDFNHVGSTRDGQDLKALATRLKNPELTTVTTTVVSTPLPIAGAGLPGLLMACGGLVALVRRRRAALR